MDGDVIERCKGAMEEMENERYKCRCGRKGEPLVPLEVGRKRGGWGHGGERDFEWKLLLGILLVMRMVLLKLLLLKLREVLVMVLMVVQMAACGGASRAAGILQGRRTQFAAGRRMDERMGAQSIHCHRCRGIRRIAAEYAQIFDEEGDFLDVEGDADEELQARFLLDVVVGQ